MLSHDTIVSVLNQLGAEVQINNIIVGGKPATKDTPAIPGSPIMRCNVRRMDTKKAIVTVDVPGNDPLQAIQAAVEAVAKANDIPTDTVTEMELLRRKMDEMQKTMDSLNKRNVQTTTAAPEPAPPEVGSTTGPGHVTPPVETPAEPAPAPAPRRRGSVAPLTQ